MHRPNCALRYRAREPPSEHACMHVCTACTSRQINRKLDSDAQFCVRTASPRIFPSLAIPLGVVTLNGGNYEFCSQHLLEAGRLISSVRVTRICNLIKHMYVLMWSFDRYKWWNGNVVFGFYYIWFTVNSARLDRRWCWNDLGLVWAGFNSFFDYLMLTEILCLKYMIYSGYKRVFARILIFQWNFPLSSFISGTPGFYILFYVNFIVVVSKFCNNMKMIR